MNYAQMSDLDIQQEVLRLTWGKHPVRFLGRMMIDIPLSDYDPCNSWADAGPIIEREFIAINPVMKGWCASSNDDAEVYFPHANPLRAAMIVFLMMQEGK